MIRVRHLWHRFGAYDVLRDVSFELGAGEIFGFPAPATGLLLPARPRESLWRPRNPYFS